MHEQTSRGWAWAGAGGLRRLAALLLTVWLSRAPARLLGRLGVVVSWLAVGALTPSCCRSVLTSGGECGRRGGHSAGPGGVATGA